MFSLQASPPISPAPSIRSTARSSVTVRPSRMARGDSMMHALRRGADNDDDPATQAAADPKPPINLKDVLAAATEHAVVTEALKRAILDMSSQFGLNIVDDNLITDKEVRASRLSKHVGCNGRRLVRQKIPMARPRELPVGVPLLRLQGARDREHTQDANRKAAISILFQFEKHRLMAESSNKDSIMLLTQNRKQQTKRLLVMTFVNKQIDIGVRNVFKQYMSAERRRRRDRELQSRAVGVIYRIWRTYRVIKFRIAMFSFIRFRKFYEQTVEARDEEAFRIRIRKRNERERVVFESYLHRHCRPFVPAGTAFAAAISDFEYPRRRAVDAQLDTQEDLVAQWMLDRLSPSQRLISENPKHKQIQQATLTRVANINISKL